MAYDPLHELIQAGIDLSPTTPEQREVIGALSEEEVALLISIQRQLQENGPEVEAHMVGGLMF